MRSPCFVCAWPSGVVAARPRAARVPACAAGQHSLDADTPLVDALRLRASDGASPFHTPGHKRGQGASPALLSVVGATALRHDLTELEGLDYLAFPRSSIARAQEVAATTFGASHTWFLVNGTSVGIHATVMAACSPGDAVVLSRNSHVSALSACILAGAVPFFADTPLDPTLGVAHAVTPSALAAALDAAASACAAAPACVVGPQGVRRQPRVALALVVTPTYFGAAADVASLAQVAHSRSVPLAVDEAHGAHWAFDPRLPAPALRCGADVVIQSTHKTLPALTQASMLHAGQGCRVDTRRLGAALAVLQTTSPSYLLLASLDAVRLGARDPVSGVSAATDASLALRASLAGAAPGLHVLGSYAAEGVHSWDVTRLTVSSASLGYATGYAAGDALAQEGITPELTAPRCVVFALGGGNAATGDMDRLRRTLLEMHASAGLRTPISTGQQQQQMPEFPAAPVQLAVSPRRAFFAPRTSVPLRQAVGRVSAEWLCPYPPGIPVAFPGSILTEEVLHYLSATLEAGGTVTGAADTTCATLEVLDGDAQAGETLFQEVS